MCIYYMPTVDLTRKNITYNSYLRLPQEELLHRLSKLSTVQKKIMLKYFTTKYEEETQKGLNLYLSNYHLNQEEHNGNGYKNVKILEKSSDYKDIMDMLVQSIKLNKNGGYKKTCTNKKSNKTKKKFRK